jgi:hypothetical protein
MTAWIVNQRTGGRTGPFLTYVQAAEFRRDVLRPRLHPNQHCPYNIVVDEPLPEPADPDQLDLFGERAQRTQQARASLAPPPDPDAWHTWLCHRCDHLFKVQGIARHCIHCIKSAVDRGVIGSETIGEASGA